MDLIISLPFLLIMSPIILFIIILLFFYNDGNVFFIQARPGKDAKIFNIIKFKTMNDKTDKNGELLHDTLRITKIGSIIRKFSLDELLQFINVIKGEMSIVGPRPLLVEYLPYYTDREKLRHSVKPGITGLAQISGRNFISWDDRLKLDVYYVEKLSFLLDLKIFFRTFLTIFNYSKVSVNSSEVEPAFDEYRSNKNINNK